MALLIHKKPAPPLSDFVDLLWQYEGYATTHANERLIRVYDSDDVQRFHTIPGCVVSGPRSEFFVIDTAGAASTFGVHFRPGGAFPFFRQPPCELSNQSVALECLWGAAAARLRERLLMAPTPQQKFLVLEQCLLEQLAKPLERHPAVSFAVQQFRGVPHGPVLQMAEAVGFSQRRFIQLFRDEVGLTPKLFCRLSRFQRVVRTVHSLDKVNLAEMALDCGYYDQAHFNHDFQEFAGITPMRYLEQKTPHVNHVPMDR